MGEGSLLFDFDFLDFRRADFYWAQEEARDVVAQADDAFVERIAMALDARGIRDGVHVADIAWADGGLRLGGARRLGSMLAALAFGPRGAPGVRQVGGRGDFALLARRVAWANGAAAARLGWRRRFGAIAAAA